jgi:hypothetical protein
VLLFAQAPDYPAQPQPRRAAETAGLNQRRPQPAHADSAPFHDDEPLR